MPFAVRARLRDVRYGFPDALGRRLPIESSEAAVRAGTRIAARGARLTLGYFAAPEERAEHVAQALVRTAQLLKAAGLGTSELALKAPPLGFDPAHVRTIAAQGLPMVFDALTHDQADRTFALARAFDCGLALPARWGRSLADARLLRDSACPIRIVKGEWADPAGDPEDVAQAFCRIAEVLAGRPARVQIATHDPVLAEAALAILAGSGTPVELGQLRGLPRRRCSAIAARRNAPLRFYYPFGPGWWPYAIEQALRRPHLPVWAARDLLAPRS